MDYLNLIFCLKEGFVPPGRYLGDNIKKLKLENVHILWYTNCVGYLNSEIDNFNNSLGVYRSMIQNYGERRRSY